MGLQFGSEKCVRMHIGKKHKEENCTKVEVDSWKEDVFTDETGKGVMIENHEGKVEMKSVPETKYLGEIISNDAKNERNLKMKTNKALGNIKQIISGLNERPYGKYTFQAAKLMRNGMLIGSLLTNCETWINMLKKDIQKIEKVDNIFHEKLLGKGSQAFKHLEMGTLPLKYVMMKKRLSFLKYILDEKEETMIRQVYDTLKTDSRKGDFVDLVSNDMKEIGLTDSEEEIMKYSKRKWKQIVFEKIEKRGFEMLIEENKTKEKTRHIIFEQLEMSEYLQKNKSTKMSKTIFQIRAGTFNVKAWRKWQYSDNLCVACQICEETMDHFMTCKAYGRKTTIKWKNIYINNSENEEKYQIALEASEREKTRKILEEDGQTSTLGSRSSIYC